MGSSSFLADLVASRGLQPEPVATEALVRLLNIAPAAATVLTDIAHGLAPGGDFTDLAFTGQAIDAESQGRPDIEGRDETGARLLVEAKFDAALTAAQESPLGYLQRLRPGSTGILIFLVPANRMPAVWPQLLAGPGQVELVPAPDLAHRDEEWLAHTRGDGRVIAALTWEALLSRLHSALDGGLDQVASADLTQLDGLVRSQIRTGWIPLAPGDFADRTGMQLWHLADALLKAANAAKVTKVTSATQDVGMGRWVDTQSGWRAIRIGLHLRAWSELGLSPIWALVWSRDSVEHKRLLQALSPLGQSGGPGVFTLGTSDIVIPISLQRGLELGRLADSIATQVVAIRALLDDFPDKPIPPDPDEPSDSGNDPSLLGSDA